MSTAPSNRNARRYPLIGEESPLGHSGVVSEGLISRVNKLESAARDDIIKGLVLTILFGRVFLVLKCLIKGEASFPWLVLQVFLRVGKKLYFEVSIFYLVVLVV